MKKNLGWIIAVVLGVLLLVAVVLPWIFAGSGYGMRPYGGMMGRGFGSMHPMGWVGMGLGWLFGLAVLVFLGLGIASLIKYLSGPNSTSAITAQSRSAGNCSNCGKPTQLEWNVCPNCGNNLREDKESVT